MNPSADLSFTEGLAASPEEESDIRLHMPHPQLEICWWRCSLNMLGVSLTSPNHFLEGRDMGHRVPTCLLLVISQGSMGASHTCTTRLFRTPEFPRGIALGQPRPVQAILPASA